MNCQLSTQSFDLPTRVPTCFPLLHIPISHMKLRTDDYWSTSSRIADQHVVHPGARQYFSSTGSKNAQTPNLCFETEVNIYHKPDPHQEHLQ
ncbi:hypothetical protein AVEN_251502-1 [Araneus ventricosus]|uniref:Uncharacterized protein n=1 Tax=Araneus ventricosus TaxID=182803 RepID=A0A4Y2X8E4_ARAVE|nr:hypothetical protein AVEN_251502-1 [Araneus ventricosus]